MKLGFLIYSYFPYGGQQRDFYRLVEACVERGHDITVYTRRWQGEQPAGIEVVSVPVNAFSRTRLYRRFTAWVEKALRSHPVDLVVGFNKMPLLDVYFAADPCFVEKADQQRGAYYKFTTRYRHFKHYEEAVFGTDSNTEVLLLSPQQRQAFTRYYPGCEARLHELPPGIAASHRVSARDEAARVRLRKELQLGDDELLILQVGSGFRVKGVDRSLQAIAALPATLRERCRYLLVGQDKPDRYRRQARRLGIGDRFLVQPGRDDIPALMAAADLLLHPAYLESAGYVLLEATIAGLPVLTTASCGYSFHIEQAGSGEVCPQPFQQEQLDERLAHMLASLDSADWSANGIAYGQNDELYSQPATAAGIIENIARSRGVGAGA